MLKIKKYILTSALLWAVSISTSGWAQNGTIRGKVIDKSTGEVLMFANVMVVGSNPPIGTETDLDGTFQLSLPAGTYDLQASYLGFPDMVIQGVQVTAHAVTVLDFLLEAQAQELEVVEISAERVNRSEVALIALRKKAPGVTDNLSAQEMARYGSANAAESMKRITGASVQEGRYIVVRGLGDRYSSAQLNGMPLPSNDPYRNSMQLDLIPANLLDNIITSKTFTPDMPGNFTGGNVNLHTRSFPETRTLQAGFSMAYNTQSSLRNDLLTHRGGPWDWLGFDDGTRQLPSIFRDPQVLQQLTPSLYIRARSKAQTAALLDQTSKALNPQMTPTTTTSPPDYGFHFSMGNQYKLWGHPLGVWAGTRLKRSFRAYRDGIMAYEELTDPGSEALNTYYRLRAAQSVDNPQVGAMAGWAYKMGSSQKLSYIVLYNHDTEKVSRMLYGAYPGIISGGGIFESRALLFRARSLLSQQLAGEHVLGPAGARVAWGLATVLAQQDEPDFRQFANTYKIQPNGDTLFFISPAEYDLPYHFFRALKDRQRVAKADLIIPFDQEKNSQNRVQIGILYRSKQRTFTDNVLQIRNNSPYAADYNGDPTFWFGPENVGIIGYDSTLMRYQSGLYVINDRKSSNQNSYQGTTRIAAAYAMVDFNTGPWRLIGGLRTEYTDIRVASRDTALPAGQIQQLDWLPAFNLVYQLTDQMNLRASFTQTLARPNMRELAPFTSFDFIGGFRITGNPTLQRTLVKNFDLRWEMLPRMGELVAISAYYKWFANPIGQAFIPEASNPEIKYVNVSDAQVYGIELELRKKLDVIAEVLKKWRFQSNFSYIHSSMAIPESELAIVRQFNPEKGSTRPFPGQSPWLINVGLSYLAPDRTLDATLSFNMYGPRLSAISEGKDPDVYERPFPLLDFSLSKGINDQLHFRLTASNLLNASFRKVMSYKGKEYLIEQYQPGTTFSLGFNYTL